MKHSHNNDHIRKSKTDEHDAFKIENQKITKRILKSLKSLYKNT